MKINEKNLCMFAVSPPVDLDGYLQKRGEVNRSWQRRHFVLKGNLLFYFEKRGDREPLGLIVIEGCTIELSEDGEPYCFQIVFHGINNRTYYLSAESQTQMEQWMKALTCAGYEYMKLMVSELQRQLDELEGAATGNGSSATTPSTANASADLNAPRPPPRRQNPFNRSAPPPPTTAAAAARTNGVAAAAPRPKVAAACEANSLASSPVVSRMLATQVVDEHINGGLVLSPGQLLTNGGGGNSNNNNTAKLPPITFDIMHRHFGRAIRNDLNFYWEVNYKPLIEL